MGFHRVRISPFGFFAIFDSFAADLCIEIASFVQFKETVLDKQNGIINTAALPDDGIGEAHDSKFFSRWGGYIARRKR
ncbi:MAG: hypothetical protein O2912_08265 [Proteobacteria bacterium]|nr:hypothetical protein [Pseudomonadota bacterium]